MGFYVCKWLFFLDVIFVKSFLIVVGWLCGNLFGFDVVVNLGD